MAERHSPLTQIIHWMTAIIVVIAFLLGPEDIDEIAAASADPAVQVHQTLGVIVFFLTLLRLVLMAFAKPPGAVSPPRWMQLAARIVQGGLYLLLLAVPATAVLGIWLSGEPVALLGSDLMASPFGQSPAIAELLIDLHPALADALLWLAGLHASAALAHHYLLKDNVLRSMLPK